MRRSPGLGWCLGRGRLGGMVEIFFFFFFWEGVVFGFGFLVRFGSFGGYDADEI